MAEMLKRQGERTIIEWHQHSEYNLPFVASTDYLTFIFVLSICSMQTDFNGIKLSKRMYMKTK